MVYHVTEVCVPSASIVEVVAWPQAAQGAVLHQTLSMLFLPSLGHLQTGGCALKAQLRPWVGDWSLGDRRG